MNTFEQVAKIRSDFEAKAESVQKSAELTRLGKQKDLQALTSEKQAALLGLVGPLRKQAVLSAIQVKKLSGAQRGLKSIEAENMDYERLRYEEVKVRSSLALAENDPQRIMEKWKLAKESGDRARIRAWLDVAPETFPAHPDQELAWTELKKDMAGSLYLIDSREMSTYENEKRAHLEGLADILRTTRKIAEDAGEEAAWQSDSIIKRVFEGISPDPGTGELNVDFGQTADESPERTYERLETEFNARAAEQAKVNQHYGVEYNPILDGA